jgi:hypothetical protein
MSSYGLRSRKRTINSQDDSHAPPRKAISPSPLDKRENTERIKAKKQPDRNPNNVSQEQDKDKLSQKAVSTNSSIVIVKGAAKDKQKGEQDSKVYFANNSAWFTYQDKMKMKKQTKEIDIKSLIYSDEEKNFSASKSKASDEPIKYIDESDEASDYEPISSRPHSSTQVIRTSYYSWSTTRHILSL